MIFIQQNGWNLFAEKDLLALGTASQWIQSSLKNIWMNIKSLQNGIMRKFLAAWAYLRKERESLGKEKGATC